MHMLERVTYYLQIRCKVSSFVRSRDTTRAQGPKNLEMSRDPDHAHLGET